MTSFVPANFSSFSSNFDFETLRNEAPSNFMNKLKSLKSPQDFFDFTRFSTPSGLIDAQQRISYNLGYFAPNYLVIVALFFLYLVFTNLIFFIIVVVEIVIAFYVQRGFGNSDELNLKIFVIHRNVWYSALLIFNIPLIFFYSPISSIFWLALVSTIIVLTHAAFINKPVEASYSDLA